MPDKAKADQQPAPPAAPGKKGPIEVRKPDAKDLLLHPVYMAGHAIVGRGLPLVESAVRGALAHPELTEEEIGDAISDGVFEAVQQVIVEVRAFDARKAEEAKAKAEAKLAAQQQKAAEPKAEPKGKAEAKPKAEPEPHPKHTADERVAKLREVPKSEAKPLGTSSGKGKGWGGGRKK